MRKILALIMCVCLLVMAFPMLSTGETASKKETDLLFYAGEPYSIAILDGGSLLQEDELPDLVNAMEAVAEYANVGFLTRPVDGDNGNSATKAQVWGNSIFGSDTRFTVFIIDMATRHLDICASKPLSGVLTSASMNSIADNVYRYASRGEYGACAIETFKLIENVLKDEKRVSEEFLFRGRIKWGMSQEKVISLEGEPFSVSDNGFITAATYTDVAISKYSGMLGYAFVSDALVCCVYAIDTADQGMFDYLKTALASVYGEVLETTGEEVYEIASSVAMKTVPEDEFQNSMMCKWKTAGDTAIYLVLVDGSVMVMYVPPDLVSRLAKPETEIIDTTGL